MSHFQACITFGVGLFLSSCGLANIPEREAALEATRGTVSACIRREAEIVAPKQVDLETAAIAVMARCTSEIRAEEQAFFNKYPGYQDFVQGKLRELNSDRLSQTRSIIALPRTRGSISTVQRTV